MSEKGLSICLKIALNIALLTFLAGQKNVCALWFYLLVIPLCIWTSLVIYDQLIRSKKNWPILLQPLFQNLLVAFCPMLLLLSPMQR